MIVTLEMYQWAKTLMVCATAHRCPKEEPCFHLAKAVIDAYEAQEHSAALARTEAADEVAHYAPVYTSASWEWPQTDWDAA